VALVFDKANPIIVDLLTHMGQVIYASQLLSHAVTNLPGSSGQPKILLTGLTSQQRH
jgi:hypothetical protein